jgi:hypothetical protein
MIYMVHRIAVLLILSLLPAWALSQSGAGESVARADWKGDGILARHGRTTGFSMPMAEMQRREVAPKSGKEVPPRSLLHLPSFSENELPFFCKMEHKWAKKMPVAVKFRLGSVEYVDWLEGKN